MKTIASKTGGYHVEETPEELALIAAEKVAWDAGANDRAFASLRQERELKLMHSDWVSSKATDTGTAVPDDWKTYKQALRDFPATVDISKWPNVTWPTPPS